MTTTKKEMTPSPQITLAKVAQDSALKEFFGEEIKDIYYAERAILKTLPKMTDAAHSPKLKKAFQDHLELTKSHIKRLDSVFELLGKRQQAKKCEAIEGIIKEGESIIEETEKGTSTRDVGLILAAQKVEHYEISTYGGLAHLANTLGLNGVSELLMATLEEEKEADGMLSRIAESEVNPRAANEQPEKK